MSNPIETFEHNGKTIEIRYDDDAISPRDADNLGVMLADGLRGYTLGDERYAKQVAGYHEAQQALHALTGEGKIREFPNWLKDNLGSTVVLALGLFDHSSISMYVIGDNLLTQARLGDTAHPQDPGGWDSGLVGFIFDTKASRDMCGTGLDHVEEALRSEVAEYDRYLTGDVYGYVIDDGDESCWGFIGQEYVKQSARDAAGCTCKHCEKPIFRHEWEVVDEKPEASAGFSHQACKTCLRDLAWGGDGWYHMNMKPWDWPDGKPDHQAELAHRYACESTETFAETDQVVGTYQEV